WTCLGLIHHLAVDNERYWFRGVAAGEPIEFPAGEDPGWLVGPQITAREVFGLYREEIARANAIIAATPLDALARAGIRAGAPGAGRSRRRRRPHAGSSCPSSTNSPPP